MEKKGFKTKLNIYMFTNIISVLSSPSFFGSSAFADLVRALKLGQNFGPRVRAINPLFFFFQPWK